LLQFFGELAVHKTMQHPNIVRFVEVFEDPENIYMILELCRNKSLMDMMRRRKRFTEPEVRFFMLQMMGALKYMHGRNVIHRDLKLGNIFLDENMNVKIGDFGLAALLVDENERKRTICGTPNYIAPEVLFGGKDGEGHSFEVDLWAVGIIMYAMLIGKPPFQSTDVDSIYKKIRQNSFEWPETVMVSQSAKALVNALLNRDPTARPSLDEIANHNFFKSGLFPRSIPVSAVREEPIWPSAGSTLAAVTASRAQWKRNYDEVARLAGVGIDSSGKPMEPVGERPGKPIDPVPMSRPPSAASAASNECADIGKLLEQKKEQDKLDAQKANGGYILPEALSPRDGHARMRNMGVLRNVPNRLAALRGTAMGIPPEQEAPPKAPTPVPEETEPEPSDEEMEEAPPPPPPPVPAPAPRNRLIDRPPVRRTAFQEKPVEKVQPEMPQAQSSKSAEAVPPRRITRSHAAQQRAAAVEPLVQTKAPVVQPEVPVAQPLRPARRLVAAEARRPTSAIVQSEPPAPLSRAPSSTDVSAKERSSSERSSSGPDIIPFGATLSTRVGKAIPETTTSVVLSSLLPIVNNLTAFINGNIRSLPPQPFATVEAVRSFRRGEKNKSIFIKKWVDYTNKYGMAYMLSDGTCATLYNDNTSMIVDKIGGDRVEWITQSHSEPARTVNGHQETVFRRLATEMSVIKQRSNTSKSLKSKLMIWKRTSNYMNNCLGVTEHWGCDRKEAIREPTVDGLTNVLLWVTHYARLRRCVIFRLIDGTIQVCKSSSLK
jgi:polo-like kinase 1